MNAYAFLGVAGLVAISAIGLALRLVASSAREAGASEVEAKRASADADAAQATLKIANQGVSDEKTVDNLRAGRF